MKSKMYQVIRSGPTVFQDAVSGKFDAGRDASIPI